MHSGGHPSDRSLARVRNRVNEKSTSSASSAPHPIASASIHSASSVSGRSGGEAGGGGSGFSGRAAAAMTLARRYCLGEPRLDAKLEPWMVQSVQSECLAGLVAEYGSPVNLLNTQPMRRNVGEIRQVAARQRVDFRPFFARKTNKCLSFVEEARRLRIGVDTASENEVRQCLDRGFSSGDLICTAAVKDQSLLELCIDQGICIAVDNADELTVVSQIATSRQIPGNIALRLGGFHHEGRKLETRFGLDVDRDQDVLNRLSELPVRVLGVHFHLDGYAWRQRVSALQESLEWIERLRGLGHHPTFVDMGGGFPMSYLEDENQWSGFWHRHTLALKGEAESITFGNHALGRTVHGGNVGDDASVYPYYQSLVRADWLSKILAAEIDGLSLAQRLQQSKLQLRCEPGRSLMDGCGMTVARVEFAKQNAAGEWLFGLSMNRTQCRTTSDDFLVDPLVVPTGVDDPQRVAFASGTEGYLVGAYCMESELLTWRKLRFPNGLRRGDLVVFPNTAGYLMHFLESRSHQFPLAKNLVLQVDDAQLTDAESNAAEWTLSADSFSLDPIDA